MLVLTPKPQFAQFAGEGLLPEITSLFIPIFYHHRQMIFCYAEIMHT